MIFIIPAIQNQFIQENVCNHAPVRRIAFAMNWDSAFTGWLHTENPFWYQQFALRQIRLLRGDQSIVDFDAADNCYLYVTTIKAIFFQGKISSIPSDNIKDHYVLVFDLTLMRKVTEICHWPESFRQQVRL